MAQASGLARVAEHERDAWAASTFGTGELILAAVAQGAREILVAVGGSATTDGGEGAIDAIRARRRPRRRAAGGAVRRRVRLRGCGARVRPAEGRRPGDSSRGWSGASTSCRAAAEGPARRPATGAAGGLSGGLWAAFDAELRPGAAAVLDALGVDERMRAAQLVVAGEGCIDEQSLRGKIVGELVRRAREAGVEIHAVVGSRRLDDEAAAAGLERIWTASTLEEIEAGGPRDRRSRVARLTTRG